MESEDLSLEEGEVVDYTPLERPDTVVQHKETSLNGRAVAIESSDEESPVSSESSDSERETRYRPKKRKLNKRSSEFSQNKSMSKYNIWSVGLQEDALTENLLKCDVETFDRSRDVESYDYNLKYRLCDGDQDQMKPSESEENGGGDHCGSNKRRHWECGKGKKRVGRRRRNSSEGDRKDKRVCRTILDLVVTNENSPEEIAKDISAKLSEAKDDLILRIVNILGAEKAIAIYNDTKRIEEDGGMMVMNGSRRRTPGGVYLCLVKHDDHIPREKIKEIFLDEKAMTQQFRRKACTQKRNQKTNEIKKSLIEDGLLLPNLLTRAELEMRNRTPEVPEGERPVTNPPPSPATDCDNTDVAASVHADDIISYNDDFLELNADDDMEVF